MTREPQPMAKRNRNFGIIALVTGALLTVGATATLITLWVTLGDRGIYADATGTAGYTTTGELVAAALAFLGLVLGLFAITIGVINLRTIRRGNSISSS